MADSSGAIAIARNTLFQDRVNLYITKVALYVMIEAGTAANHQERVDFASKVLAGTAPVFQIALSVLTDAAILGAADPAAADFGIADADLDFRVNSLFNQVAGIHQPAA